MSGARARLRGPHSGRGTTPAWRLTWALAALAVLAFLVVFFVWPVLAMLSRGFVGESGGLDLAGLWATLSAPRTWKIVWQTVWMALAGAIGSLVLGVPVAYVLYRLRFPGRMAWRVLVAIPFALPTVVVGTAFRSLLADSGPLGFLGLGETTTAVVLAMIFFNVSVVVRVVGPVWAGLDPGQVAAARTLGASPWQAFRTVTLVQLGPALAGATALVFLFCSTSFGLVQTLGRPGYGTLESEIYIQTTTYVDLQAAGALSLLQFLVVAVAIWASTRWQASTETPLNLGSDTSEPARGGRAVFAVVVLLGVAALIVGPMAALVIGSLSGPDGLSLYYYYRLGNSGEGFAGGASVVEALGNSVEVALKAALIALVAGVGVSLLVTRPGGAGARGGGGARSGSEAARATWLGRGQRALEGTSLLPLGISAVTVGFGYLITLGTRIDTPQLVPLAQAIVALPLVVRILTPALRSIDPRQRAAAATLGASPWMQLATLDLPRLGRGLGQAAAFAFAISIGEFGATSFLASADYQTLPVLISRLLSRPGADNFGMALAGAVILGIVSAAAMAGAELLRPATEKTHD